MKLLKDMDMNEVWEHIPKNDPLRIERKNTQNNKKIINEYKQKKNKHKK